MESSTFLRHIPCDSCGSSDGNSEYTDGHTHCFACGAHRNSADAPSTPAKESPRLTNMLHGKPRALDRRKITVETCEHFGYAVAKDREQTVQVAPYYDANRKLVAQKVRTPDKNFYWIGDSKQALPFGSHCFQRAGKQLVITEGEIDAMAVAQVFGLKWPVWSIACGADKPTTDDGQRLPMNKIRKYIAQHREHFLAFDRVVLCFDGDEQGRESAKVAAQVIGPKAHIAELPLKDAGEMLEAGRTDELYRAIWAAQQYRPEGIIDVASLRAEICVRPETGLPYPWPSLTGITYGHRTGELIGWGAGVSSGKTEVLAEIITQAVVEHRQKVGAIFLESTTKEITLRCCGKVAEKRFHIPGVAWEDSELLAAFDRLGQGNLFLYDAFGRHDWEPIKEKIRYLFHVEGVTLFVLDHLTALAAAAEESEKDALEQIMADLGGMVKEMPISIHFVSHLTTPSDGKSHEEGGRVTIRQFKGSRAISQWATQAYGLERNQQAATEEERYTTTIRCLKQRLDGSKLGQTFFVRYNMTTGKLEEVPGPGRSDGFRREEPDEDGSNDF